MASAPLLVTLASPSHPLTSQPTKETHSKDGLVARILNPFYTTRRDDGGTGLGLAVAARIVDEHEGKLSYESEPGKGTLARLSLPMYRKDEA